MPNVPECRRQIPQIVYPTKDYEYGVKYLRRVKSRQMSNLAEGEQMFDAFDLVLGA